MAERYNFKYLPLVGKLPGKSMVEQTESAINELASVVYDNVGYVGNLAEEVQTANTNASNALEKATEALETSGRVYIKLIAAVDVNDYYDSELYYINNDGSANIPVRDRGFLEVKTNDDKTACEQVFIADDTGLCYFRHGVITSSEVGGETVYSVTWGTWSSELASQDYVQQEVNNEADRVDENFLPLSGGTLTGDVNGVTPPNGDDSKKLANTEFIQALASILVPTGCVQAFAGQNTPNGWLLCDGSAVSRTTYAKLFSVIGTSYGSGDGSATFNLPNLVDKFVEGSATAGTVKSAGLPNITGQVSCVQFLPWPQDAAVRNLGGAIDKLGHGADRNKATNSGTDNNGGNGWDTGIMFNASKSNPIYGSSNTVQPPALTMRYIIKY